MWARLQPPPSARQRRARHAACRHRASSRRLDRRDQQGYSAACHPGERWPLYSKRLKYDSTPVDYGKELGIELDLADIEQPVVDLTPSPAVSSFVFYDGDAFPEWRHNLIVGTLKATELYRMVVEDNRVVHRETLLAGFARIRDVENGPDGAIYLLLEHASGAQIVRLVPAN